MRTTASIIVIILISVIDCYGKGLTFESKQIETFFFSSNGTSCKIYSRTKIEIFCMAWHVDS